MLPKPPETVVKPKLQQAHDQWLELKNGAREEDIAQSNAKVQAAQAALEWQTKAHEDLTIKASIDGTIDTLPWHEGDRVTAGTQLISLLSSDHPYARSLFACQRVNQNQSWRRY